MCSILEGSLPLKNWQMEYISPAVHEQVLKTVKPHFPEEKNIWGKVLQYPLKRFMCLYKLFVLGMTALEGDMLCQSANCALCSA